MQSKPEVQVWMGSNPEKCDICSCKIEDDFIDGRTKYGPWANMCPACHCKDGVGLGTGKGQKYKKSVQNGLWVKQ